MGTCKTLVRTSFFVLECGLGTTRCSLSPVSSSLFFSSLLSHTHARLRVASRRCFTSAQVAASIEPIGYIDEALHANSIIEPPEDQSKDTVEHLLNNKDDVTKLMKMKRKPLHFESHRWFPYLDSFKSGNGHLKSSEILEALDPYIMDERKERFRNVVKNRSYSVCLVVEGLSDFGNVSAAFRSADALGFQSVHVIACESSKRCINFEVSIYDMDWSCPTAIVVGNENRGISDEALELSDLHCSIPMKGMVDSFNVSVAAGILMHHAVCDRTTRMGCHGDLTIQERQILLAEFSLRHNRNAISIVHEYAKRKAALLT